VITAVDTSVLLDVFKAEKSHVFASQAALRKAMRDGALVACDVVWAELRPWFRASRDLVRTMEMLGVAYSPTTLEAALEAGKAWHRYRLAGGPRDRLIPDFLVAGHALVSAERFLTRDRGFYRRWFEDLRILEP